MNGFISHYIPKGLIILKMKLFWVYWKQMEINQGAEAEKSFNEDLFKQYFK